MSRKKDDYSIIDLDIKPSEYDTADNYKDDYQFDYNKEKKNPRRSKDRILKAVLVALCFYLSFLIVGVSVTQFYTNEKSEKQVIFVNFDYIKDKKDYNAYKKKIVFLRDAITDIYVTRNAVASGQLTQTNAINKFTLILKPLDNEINEVNVLDVQEDNTAIKTQLYNTLKNDVALCLQQYINGYQQNNETLIADGDAYFSDTCNAYDSIMSAITESANNLHMNDDEFLSWDFEKEIEEKNLREGYSNGL